MWHRSRYFPAGGPELSATGPSTPRPGGAAAYGRGVMASGALSRAGRGAGRPYRLGPVADPELAVDRAGVLLDRVRGEVEALADLAVGRARWRSRSSTSRSRAESGVAGLVGCLRPKTSMPSATIRTALTTSAAPQSLETNRTRRRPGPPPRETRAGAGDQQDPRLGRGACAAPRHSSAPDSLAEEEVDERDVGLQPLGELERLVGGAGRLAALDPRLALEQQAEAPVDDVVVVDDQDAERRARCLGVGRRPLAITGGSGAPTSRTCQRSSGSGAELDQGVVLERLEGEQAQARGPAPAPSPPAPSLVTSSSKASSGAPDPDLDRSAVLACFSQLRSASRKTDCASSSSCVGHLDALVPVDRQLGRPLGRAGRPGRPASCSGRRSREARRPAERRAKVAERRLKLVVAFAAARRPTAARRSRATRARPNRRCITRSWISRVSSIRSFSWRVRSSWRVARSTLAASAASRPRVRIVSRSSLGELERAAAARRRRCTPSQRPPAATGPQAMRGDARRSPA